MKTFSVADYGRAGCPFMKESAVIFVGLHKVVGGKVCDTGCGQFDGGRCVSYTQLLREVKADVGQKATEAVRGMAHRLNISISEVRRRRQGWKARATFGPCGCEAHVKERKEASA